MSSVYQRVMSDGAWEINLKPDTPRAIINLFQPFNVHVVITPGELDVGSSDAVFLAAARFVGPLRRLGRNRLQPGGPGNSMWLSDPDGKGEIMESAVSAATPTLGNWINALLPTSINAGTVTSPGGSYSNTYQYVSRRQAIDDVCRVFGVEWKVNNDWTMDVGTVANLYRSVAAGETPAAMVARGFGGRDPGVVGIRGNVDVDIDWDDYINDVIVLAHEVGDAAGIGVFRKPMGPFIDWQRVVVSPTTPAGGSSGVALSLRAQLQSDPYGHREVKVSTDVFDVAGDITLGDDVWVYDPQNGLVDTANQVTYQGQLLPAVAMRCIGMRWPVREGMGVYLRVSQASPIPAVYYNITPYVEFDDGDADLELGAASRLLREDVAGNLIQATPVVGYTPWTSYTPTWTGAGSNPAIGNGTIVGYYKREGTTLHLRGRIIMGSTTTYGTGEWRVSLPSGVSTAGATSEYQLGHGMAVDTGTASFGIYPVSDPAVSQTSLRLFYESTAGSQQAAVTSTTPHTWANTDVCAWNITMEVDP